MKIASVAALAAAVLLGACAQGGNSHYGTQKVVYQLNQPGGDKDQAYMQALTYAQNHVNAVGKENIDLEFVLFADGINLLKSAKDNVNLQAKVINLKEQKVKFLVCNNTLKARKLDPDKDLFDVDKADIVPAGVAEVARLETMGYAYIRP
ncbi:DsrE family protein [Magnetospirillum sp. UT-4]|uniref:DsrE family protein n=1 Tax=Magnetospirillum sp. UT-4 TaxID=2681467 RepID=UPI0013833681|nr:DsrE family protein [Magnetospirillum sp. UT-4]CAA7624617.1 conserved exported hypothetical protein [Magnetospirillum sp. UT-4]